MDLAVVNLEWMISLALDGDGEMLAELIRQNEPVHPILREFLADVVSGKIRLAPRRKLTYKSGLRRYLSEKMVVFFVESEMRDNGKQRDKALRTKLTHKWCKAYGTTINAVDDYLRYQKSRDAKRRARVKK